MIQFNTDIPRADGVYIVGGSVRDLLLGRLPTDYDIAVLENPEKFARMIAKRINGHLTHIGKSDQMVIRVSSGDTIFDIASVNGSSIEDDLNQRDFTINAMACSLSSGDIIDTMKARRDLAEKKIRMISKAAFQKDPIRLIRAYRLGAHLNFEIEPRTASAIKENALLIQKSAGERIREELLKLLSAPGSHHYLNQMASTGLLFAIFPELLKLQRCDHNRQSPYNLFKHTMDAYHNLETVLNAPESFMPGNTSRPIPAFNKSSRASLKTAMLLHEIGKPEIKTDTEKEDMRLHGYEDKSAEMAKKICARLRFSNREKRFIDFILRNHLKPFALFKSRREKDFNQNHAVRFFIKCEAYTFPVLLHSLADIENTNGDMNHETFKGFVKNLLHTYFNFYIPNRDKSPLITGYDLISEFDLPPSSLFKKILLLTEEARLMNRIKSKKEALRFAKELLD